MSEVTLAGLLQALYRGQRSPKVSPSQARDDMSQWLAQLRCDAEQAGASPAQVSALACLQRSFLGPFIALSTPWLEEVGTKKVPLGFLDITSVAVPEYEARVGIREDMLFDQLRAAAEALDDLLARLAPPPPPPPEPRSWAEDGKLLEQLQPLFGALATQNGDAALAELGLLAERLRAQGVEMVLADEDTAGYFKLYDGEADDYVTVTPAITVRGELRQQGEARRPRGGDQQEGMPR
jgi:hypothetical protein